MEQNPAFRLVHGFESFPETRKILEQGLQDGAFPGVVAGVWSARDPDLFHLGWGGDRRLKHKGLSLLPMERETIFDLASVSKVFATGGLAMALIERGWIRWDTTVQSILPEYRYAGTTLRHLASHTSGLPAWAPLFEKVREFFHFDELETVPVDQRQWAMRKFVFDVDLERAVGTKAVYSDIGFLLLGFCLEEVTRLPLDKAVERFLWKPMGLHEHGDGPFYVRTENAAFRARIESVAATEDCPWRKAVIQGQVHDDNCWAMGGYGGHAGAFGTARDLLHYGKKLLAGYFSREVMHEAWKRVAEPEECDRTPGWDTPSGDTPAFGKKFSAHSVGHLGFTGTSFWIDPKNGIAVTLLTNRVHLSRENIQIRAFRGAFHDAVAFDLGLD